MYHYEGHFLLVQVRTVAQLVSRKKNWCSATMWHPFIRLHKIFFVLFLLFLGFQLKHPAHSCMTLQGTWLIKISALKSYTSILRSSNLKHFRLALVFQNQSASLPFPLCQKQEATVARCPEKPESGRRKEKYSRASPIIKELTQDTICLTCCPLESATDCSKHRVTHSNTDFFFPLQH